MALAVFRADHDDGSQRIFNLGLSMFVAFAAGLPHNEVWAQKSSGNVSLGKGQFVLPLARGVRDLVGLGSMGYI
jgi:hypothetical protein